MEELNRKTIDRAVLVGLNADCFTKEETATETVSYTHLTLPTTSRV